MALRKFNAKKYQIAKLNRRNELSSKRFVEPIITTAPASPVVKPTTPKLRASKSTK
jgi:hypothetical protein